MGNSVRYFVNLLDIKMQNSNGDGPERHYRFAVVLGEDGDVSDQSDSDSEIDAERQELVEELNETLNEVFHQINESREEDGGEESQDVPCVRPSQAVVVERIVGHTDDEESTAFNGSDSTTIKLTAAANSSTVNESNDESTSQNESDALLNESTSTSSEDELRSLVETMICGEGWRPLHESTRIYDDDEDEVNTEAFWSTKPAAELNSKSSTSGTSSSESNSNATATSSETIDLNYVRAVDRTIRSGSDPDLNAIGEAPTRRWSLIPSFMQRGPRSVPDDTLMSSSPASELINAQNEAFERVLEEEQRAAEAEQLKDQLETEERERRITEALAILPPEPDDDEDNVVRVRINTGQEVLERRFNLDDPVSGLYNFVTSRGHSGFTLETYERVAIDESSSQRLGDLEQSGGRLVLYVRFTKKRQ